MIYIGYYNDLEKIDIVKSYNCKKNIMFSYKDYAFFDNNIDSYFYDDIIKYKVFYKMLSIIGGDTLVIINECLRDANKFCLTYNCLKHFLKLTKNIVIFQSIPIINSKEDFGILKMFNDYSDNRTIKLKQLNLSLEIDEVELNKEDFFLYENEKEKQFNKIGNRDPEIIPRSLHLYCGNFRKRMLEMDRKYICRTIRYKNFNFATYNKYDDFNRIVFDFPNSFIKFRDYLTENKLNEIVCILSNSKVDNFYKGKYHNWIGDIGSVCSEL